MLIKVCKIIIYVLGAISSVVTIISGYFQYFDIKVSRAFIVIDFSFLNGNYGVFIFFISLISTFLFMIYVISCKRREMIRDKMTSKKLNEVIFNMQSFLVENLKTCDMNIYDKEDIVNKTIYDIKQFFFEVLNIKVNVTIKIIVSDQSDIKNAKLMTKFDTFELYDVVRRNHNCSFIKDNSEYFDIVSNKKDYGFLNIGDEHLRRITISDSNWRRFYKSFVVIPIRNADQYPIGFLCVDSLSSIFDSNTKKIVFPFLQTIAANLFLILSSISE